jgi:hypothetical protein
MKNPLLLAAFVLTAFPVIAPGAIVDRVEIAVGNKVITQSDIEQRIRLTAFQNSDTLDFSLATRRQMAQRLIDQTLIGREMEVGHYPRIGTPTVDDMFTEFQTLNYPNADPVRSHSSMLAALTKYGLTEAELRADLARQADLLTFLSLRFRPGIDVTVDEIKKYFDEKVLEAAKQELGLGGMRAEIQQEIAKERADKELDTWLQDQRKRTKIEYPDPDLSVTTEPAKMKEPAK